MEKHLIALDLDGTSLYDWSTMTQDTIDTIKEIRAQGHTVVIATGRPYRSSKKYYDLLELDTPIINYNGALIQHPFDSNFPVSERFLPLEAVYQIFNDNEHFIENAFCEHYEDIYLYRMDETILPLVHPEGGHIIEGSFKQNLKINPNGFILITKVGQNKPIEDYIKKHFKGVLDCRNWGGEFQNIIEVYTPETCKGIALQYLMDYYDIPRERLIAFGDGHNDVEMIRFAGLGVAMENAVEPVKAVADAMTKTNKEDGVAYFLKKYFKLDKKKEERTESELSFSL